MKVSWRWLEDLVDLSGVSVEEAIRLLPLRVVDVDGVERLGGLEGVVTALVLDAVPHPGADRLRVCTVDQGPGAPVQVVCGAPNVAKGQVVCFARVGTTLPNGLTLEARKIRGVQSQGMICAEDELGLGTDHDGILVLPEGTPLGRPAAEVLGVSDVVIDLNNAGMTNRPDLWGHVGVARELGAILGRPLRLPPTPRAEEGLLAAGGKPFPVEIEDGADCRRYVGLVVEGVVNGPSPADLARRLERLGMRSVDLVVDLTNLVLWEQGQPVHAFDLARIEGGRVAVRRARAGETLTTLDGRDRVLDPEDLVIADGVRVLALAGVMGGEASGVTAATTTILLESACFDPGRVRRTATRHGLRTDASTRFEKSLDPEGARTAALRFAELLLAHVPTARLVRPLSDFYPRPYPATAIPLEFDLVRRRLGWPVSDADVVRHLESVGFACKAVAGGVRAQVPTWRATKDIALPEDLVEEVARLDGLEHVRSEAPLVPMEPRRPQPVRALERVGRAALCLDLGYAETATYVFHGAREEGLLGLDPARLLHLAHPMSAEQDRLQVTTAQNLLAAAARNQPREATLRLAEWSRIFPKGERRGEGLPHETRVLGVLFAERDTTNDPQGRVFLSLKEDLLAWFGRVGLPQVAAAEAGEATLHDDLSAPTWFHPGRRAALSAGGVVLGLVGEVLPRVAREFGLAGRVAFAEVNLDRVLAAGLPGRPYRPVARFPEAPFDVSVLVPRRTSSEEVAAVLRAASPEAVRSVQLFDAYEGTELPPGQRSLAFTVTFGDDAATLSPKALERLQGRALAALRERGWTVRTAPGPGAEPDARP